MKHKAEVDLSNPNTSHTIMVSLVGPQKRVLDVGCATGYLAGALIANGCTVSGVEIDPDAAEKARPLMSDLVVADVEEVDLAAHFGSSAFDVVVFGDVLEHLKDPLKVLRSSMPLLTPDGFIVASIPNVAHGSVRLALLQGKFDYSEQGLLDSAHLRFFTRQTLEALLRDADLLLIDVRRTTAGLFETEIPLEPADYAPELLESLSKEDEGTTYQFVVKAIPAGTSPAVRALAQRAWVQEQEIQRLRRELAAVTGSVGRLPLPAHVGILGSLDAQDLCLAVLANVTSKELRRRLPSATIRLFSPRQTRLNDRLDVGHLVGPLQPWATERAASLVDELDAVVVVGPIGGAVDVRGLTEEDQAGYPLPAVLAADHVEAPPRRGQTVFSAVELAPQTTMSIADCVSKLGRAAYATTTDPTLARPSFRGDGLKPIEVVPDPLLLAERFYGREFIEARSAYLRLMNWLPPGGPVILLHGTADLLPLVSPLARAVDDLVTERAATCVLLEGDSTDGGVTFAREVARELSVGRRVVPIEAGPADMVTAIAASDVVVSSSRSILALAFAFGRPHVGLDLLGHGHLDTFADATSTREVIARRTSDIDKAVRLAPDQGTMRDEILLPLQAKLDATFDHVADLIRETVHARRGRGQEPAVFESLEQRLAAVEAAYAGLTRRMAAERLSFANRAVGLEQELAVARQPPPLPAPHPTNEELDRALAIAADARDELEAMLNTKTMRLARPARRLYARLRGRTL